MDEHQQKVERLSQEVAVFYEAKRPFYIYHGSTNSTRHLQFKRGEIIDTSSLNAVLEVDAEKQVAIVEPNVPMDKLVKATLAHGLIPPVVMEFPGITVGGGIQGFAAESSSYKWGVFNATAETFEIVLGDGTVVTASAEQNDDLFHGTAGSFGSLGILTKATIKLIPAKKYVVLTYIPVDSFQDAVSKIQDYTLGTKYDYVDGIMFSKDNGVIILGQLSDKKEGSKARFLRAHDDWYYLHAEKISQKRAEYTESVPLTDYLFRYDRGAFWVGRYAFERSGWPFNRLTRWFVNSLMHTRKLYQALHISGASQQYIIQDLALPTQNAVKFMDYIDQQFHTYPLWLCPLKLEKDWIMMREDSTETVINIGVWDNHAYVDHDEFVAANRQIEAKLRELNGQKWFYAHAYYTEKEFWSLYSKPRYDKLRKKYHADTLPTVFEKIQNKARKPVRIKKASFMTLFGLGRLKVED